MAIIWNNHPQGVGLSAFDFGLFLFGMFKSHSVIQVGCKIDRHVEPLASSMDLYGFVASFHACIHVCQWVEKITRGTKCV